MLVRSPSVTRLAERRARRDGTEWDAKKRRALRTEREKNFKRKRERMTRARVYVYVRVSVCVCKLEKKGDRIGAREMREGDCG